jgi:hypothetical protein
VTTLLCRRAAPTAWIAAQLRPDLDRRRRVVEACRAELAWARADWLEAAGVADHWDEACLPHERAAARLLELWGDLQPLEDRLKQGLQRLRSQRRAGWDTAATLEDVQRYRRARVLRWRQWLLAAADYRDARAQLAQTPRGRSRSGIACA